MMEVPHILLTSNGSRMPVVYRRTVFGSNPQCHVVLKRATPKLHFEHAFINYDFTTGAAALVNLAEDDTVKLNGLPSGIAMPLQDGDYFTICGTGFKWEAAQTQASKETHSTSLVQPLANVHTNSRPKMQPNHADDDRILHFDNKPADTPLPQTPSPLKPKKKYRPKRGMITDATVSEPLPTMPVQQSRASTKKATKARKKTKKPPPPQEPANTEDFEIDIMSLTEDPPAQPTKGNKQILSAKSVGGITTVESSGATENTAPNAQLAVEEPKQEQVIDHAKRAWLEAKRQARALEAMLSAKRSRK